MSPEGSPARDRDGGGVIERARRTSGGRPDELPISRDSRDVNPKRREIGRSTDSNFSVGILLNYYRVRMRF